MKLIVKYAVFLQRVFFFGIALALFLKGPMIDPDTAGYETYDLCRSPLYPLLIKASEAFFGSLKYQALIAFQLSFGVGIIFYVQQGFKELYRLKNWVLLLFSLLLFSPYYGATLIGNHILTEGLAYPLFLWAVIELLKGLFLKENKAFLRFLGLVPLCVLTRTQFMFMGPVVFIALLYLFFCQPLRGGKFLLVGAAFMALLSTSLLEKTYHYLNSSQFVTVPKVGTQLLVLPLYLSNPEDRKYLKEPSQLKLFDLMQNEMQRRKYNARAYGQIDPGFNLPVDHYYGVYNGLYHWVIMPAFRGEISETVLADQVALEMALTLMKAQPKEWISFYLRSLIQGFGGYYNFAFLIFALIFAFYIHFKQRDLYSGSFCFVGLLTLGNLMLVALVEPILRRYSIYTEILTLCFLFTILIRGFTLKGASGLLSSNHNR